MKNLQLGGMWGLAGLLGIVLSVAGSAQKASAVSVTTSTYAKDTGPAVPNPNPNLKGPTTVIQTTSATASMKSDTNRAHATANAVSKVVGGKITKAASGSAWADASPLPLYDSRSFSFSAVASGTQFIAQTLDPGNPANPAQVPFSINFPANDDPSFDYGFPSDGVFFNAFETATPTQGIVRRNAGLTPAQLASIPASLTTPVLEVQIVLEQNGISTTLFSGSATFNNDPNNSVTFGGSFLTSGVTASSVVEATGPIRTRLGNLPKIDFTVEPDKEFDLLVDIRFALGNPLATVIPEFDFSIVDPMNGNFGIAAAFGAEPEMEDTRHFQLNPVPVPEPAGIVLAVLGIAAIAGFRHRQQNDF